MTLSSCRRLTGNTLKVIAAILMVIDHVGALLLPEVLVLRAIGRPGFPLFAFVIAEGCRHTRHRTKHFLSVFTVAAVCQVAFTVATGSYHMNALLTFSVAILLCYALDVSKSLCLSGDKAQCAIGILLFPLAVATVWALTRAVSFDYGFFGCMAPVFFSLFHPPRTGPCPWSRLDRIEVHVACLSIGLFLLARVSHPISYWMFAALPLLLLYSGKRGRLRMKWFFYIFYPAHFLLILGAGVLLSLLH